MTPHKNLYDIYTFGIDRFDKLCIMAYKPH